MRKICCLVLLCLFASLLYSQQSTWDQSMQLKACSIDIKTNHFTATTFIEMEFYNPGNTEMEGLYRFKLATNQVITGFQLDLHGKYRDGSIEEKWKATNAYNTIVGKRIDPALLTMESPHQYSLRIYPVPAKGSRKITMTVQQLLVKERDSLHYSLPLFYLQPVDDLNIRISVRGNKPFITNGLLRGLSFQEIAPYSVDYKKNRQALDQPVMFSIPLPKNHFLCTGINDSAKQFALRLAPTVNPVIPIKPSSLLVLWDISGSSSRRNINAEINFLQAFILKGAIQQISIVTFNSAVRNTVVFDTDKKTKSWMAYLRGLAYDGATQLGCLDLTDKRDDLVLLFSDGNNTYGDSRPVLGNRIVHAVASSKNLPTENISQLIAPSGGQVIDLNKLSMDESLQKAMQVTNRLLKIESGNESLAIDQQLPLTIEAAQLLTGKFSSLPQPVYLFYGYSDRYTHIEKIDPADNSCQSESIARIPLLSGFDELIRSRRWNEQLEAGIKEKIVTLNTAYIVLERIEDYTRYNIELPADLKVQYPDLYVKRMTKTEREQLLAMDETDILQAVARTFNQQQARKKDPAQKISEKKEHLMVSASWAKANTSVPAPTGETGYFGIGESSSLSEVVVTGYGIQRQQRMVGSSVSISSREITQSSSIEQALQGKLAGIAITQSDPLSTPEVRIRGYSSMLNNSPLFIVDGIPVSGNINDVISTINIQDITVLKDAAATALYGSRGSRGVIIINTKKWPGNSYNSQQFRRYKLSAMDDVGYLAEIKEVPRKDKLVKYRELKKEYENSPGFYFDMAQHFFESNLKASAMAMLMNAAEVSNGELSAMFAVGYLLENWKEFDKAIEFYRALSIKHPHQLSVHRSLALAYLQAGLYQNAVDQCFLAIRLNTLDRDPAINSLKATILEEMNMIITQYPSYVNVDSIPVSMITEYKMEFRMVFDNNGGYNDPVSIEEPGGSVCSAAIPVSKNGGTLEAINYYRGKPQVYQIKKAVKGKYKIIVRCFNIDAPEGKIPQFMRMMIFKNVPGSTPTIEVRNVILDNQYGDIEIDQVAW